MKKKKLTYILLIVVVGVWGLIIFKFLNYFSNEPQVFSNTNQVFQKDTTSKISFDTIALQLNYPDPFLKGVYMPKVVTQQTEKPVVEKKPQPVPVQTQFIQRVFWPQIQFNGVIISKGISVAILRINNQSLIIPKGQSVNQVTVLKFNQDSIKLEYKHEQKVFYKE